MKNSYNISFIYKKDTEKSLMVQKKTKSMNNFYFIPKSIILNKDEYIQTKRLWKDCDYQLNKVMLELPKWFVDKELKFYK